jgi:hypothetical protein
MSAGAPEAAAQLLFLGCAALPGGARRPARAQELDTAWTLARPHLRSLRDLFRGRAGAEPPGALGAREARAALAALRGAADGLWQASCRVLDDAGFSLLKGCQARACLLSPPRARRALAARLQLEKALNLTLACCASVRRLLCRAAAAPGPAAVAQHRPLLQLAACGRCRARTCICSLARL